MLPYYLSNNCHYPNKDLITLLMSNHTSKSL